MSGKAVASTRIATPKVASLAGRVLQRQCACGQHAGGGECEACSKKKKLSLQRHPQSSAAPGVAPAIVHDVLRSPGQALDPSARAALELGFGHDFSHVRVHTDSHAQRSAQAVNALAYTVGNNIVFGAGQYAPQTAGGRRLLAHELVHSMQQASASATPAPLPVTSAGDGTEREADTIASHVLRGDAAAVPQGSGRRVARAPAPGPSEKPADAPVQDAPRTRPEEEGEMNIHRSGFGVFDTGLDRHGAKQNQPCRLTLTTNVNFTPQGPWPAGSFAKWERDVMRIVTNRWSFRFMLAPSQPCKDEPCKSATAIFKIVPVTTTAANVKNVTVRFAKPPGTRSDSSNVYKSDIEPQSKDLRRGHAPITHEAGHWLGVEHIHCNTNADECYGVTDNEKADIMGGGEIVSERDYAPFAEAISRITKCDWKPVGHGNTSLFGSSFVAPLAVLGGALGAFAGALAGASSGAGTAIGLGVALGAAGAGLGALTGMVADEVAR